MSRALQVVYSGRPIFITGVRPRFVRARLWTLDPVLERRVAVRAGYRNGIGGSFVWLVV